MSVVDVVSRELVTAIRELTKELRQMRLEKQQSIPDPREQNPIDSLCLSVRAHYRLRSRGIRTIGDLLQFTAKELLETRGFGEVCLREIMEALDRVALHLKAEK